jgi:hypothetical protein
MNELKPITSKRAQSAQTHKERLFVTNEIDKTQMKTVAIYLCAAANACERYEEQPEALNELRLLTMHYAKQVASGASA